MDFPSNYSFIHYHNGSVGSRFSHFLSKEGGILRRQSHLLYFAPFHFFSCFRKDWEMLCFLSGMERPLDHFTCIIAVWGLPCMSLPWCHTEYLGHIYNSLYFLLYEALGRWASNLGFVLTTLVLLCVPERESGASGSPELAWSIALAVVQHVQCNIPCSVCPAFSGGRVASILRDA